MPKVLDSSEMSPLLKIVSNMNGILAWITGYARDAAAMKRNVQQGYQGEYSDHVHDYHELGSDHYSELAELLLESLDLRDMEVLDVGCGTGILSFAALEKGAARVASGDLSDLMLDMCRRNANDIGYDQNKIEFQQCDAEDLPFKDSSFDTILSGMVLGMVPDQAKAVSEMARVLRPGGTVAFSAHGPKNNIELVEVTARVWLRRYPLSGLGYRVEYWPFHETTARSLLIEAGFTDVQVKRQQGSVWFQSADQAYDYLCATSSLYWYGKVPVEKREGFSKHAREYFQRKNIREVTTDVILAYGKKPD